MSFRLRIFLLVLVVTGTAIGATAWLTLSLTRHELTRAEQARDRHQADIVAAVQTFGLLNGRWNGIDSVTAVQAEKTGLHIRIVTRESDEVLADSDTIDGRAAGPVQLLPADIDAKPVLDQETVFAAHQRGTVLARRNPDATPQAEAFRKTGLQGRFPVRSRPDLPAGLFDVTPTGDDPAYRALLQLTQYRAALASVRCMADKSTVAPSLILSRSPYLDSERRAAQPGCVQSTVERILSDDSWLDEVWYEIAGCDQAYEAYGECLDSGFSRAAVTTSAIPVRVFFGARQDTELAPLQRPALFGAAGLLLVAAIGTAWIARRVSRPVRLLTGASLQLAAGRLDVRVPTRGEDELARLSGAFNAMAEALQRSEERQRRLVADVAHELRTPLSNLRGYLEGLADGVIEPTPELFASLHEETLLQRRILEDLQVLAQAEAGELGYDPVPLDLSELAATTATAHRAVAAAAGIDVVVDAPAPVEVYADPDRIRQVLGNLMSNAIRYTDAGGRVELRVTRDGPDAVLTVRDTGVGMNAEEVSRVFDRFWRADLSRQRATGGSGLGLTIARRIIADQGGSLDAESTAGVGTTFTARLPMITRPPGQPFQ
ncbi:sensor histidine kinase [Actinoplanes derwentensis]|uniref:histidine kinase n=1 Tax=Actinoplanes derwentensis TaxID=113562 RepID=A0A1H1QR51_9ACTN|nr:ATP-binding protein [Actinoplanes derwentensis]GID89353.1 two-component sensor histidine kinase [Actinoplanes derwentensis]SDS25972.1 two-component system, OmpR family, sensor histidine kinase BaeS [Actinoplanes derwentensis]